MIQKTNAMRMLDSWGIEYKIYDYSNSWKISWIEVANYLNINPQKLFKTLVTEWNSKKNYVFLVPVSKELDLKKAAKSVWEKSINMIKQSDLLSLTGYIHWWCSPIWMKKQFPTIIDSSAQNFDTIIFNAGKIWYQVELDIKELEDKISIIFEDIV